MRKYIIWWDAGYGKSYEVVDAPVIWKAREHAYNRRLQEAESKADYNAIEWTQELEDELLLRAQGVQE